MRSCSLAAKLAIALLCLSLVGRCEAAIEGRTYHVLVISSLQQGALWTQSMMTALQSTFISDRRDIELQVDYMHTQRVRPTETYYVEKGAVYKYEFAKLRFDVIIAMGSDALGFMVHYGDRLFSRAPVVFCGASNLQTTAANRLPNYKGISINWNLKRNIELILRLLPGTHQIVFPHDRTTAGREMASDARAIAADFPGVRFTFLTNMNIGDILTHVRSLPSDAVVLPLPFAVDKSGRFFAGTEAWRMIASASSVPVFGLWDVEIGSGIIGGLVLDEKEYGRQVAQAALRAIGGQSVKSVPILTRDPLHYMFDLKQMRRFDIPLTALPRGSTVVGGPQSYMRLHRNVILITVAIVAALLGLITILGMNILRRRRAESALRDSEERYKLLFERSPDLVVMLRNDRFVAANPAAIRILGYEPSEIIGRTPWDISPKRQPDGMPSEAKAKLFIDLAQRIGPQTFEWVHQRKDGSEVECEIGQVAYRLKGVLYTQAIIRDVTERKHAEEARREFERQVDEQKRRFYRDTLLSVTDGKLEICEASDLAPYLRDAEITIAVRDPSDIPPARNEIAAFCRDKGLEGDRLHLFITAVGEAIDNAVKHAPEGHVYAGTQEESVWVGVADNGPGMDSLALPYVALRRGFSTKASMGLGYSIMLNVADRVLLATGKEGTTVVLFKRIVEVAPELSLEQLPDTWSSVP